MIQIADFVLTLADEQTKIIPCHGKLGDKQALQQYRDMLVTVRDRMQEIIDLQPNKDLNDIWGKGFLDLDAFLSILYTVTPDK